MTRAYQIFGPAMVQCTFSPAIPLADGSSSGLVNVRDLGLTSEAISIVPNFHHQDIYNDSFGNQIPADTLCYLADCQINLKLVHYDDNVLGFYLRESLAGSNTVFGLATLAGTMPSAGTPMGGGFPLYSSGNHYVGLTIHSTNPLQSDWIFPATYLTGPPISHPVGTERSITECKIRALPYQALATLGSVITGSGIITTADAQSAGAELWSYAGIRF